MDNKVYYFDYKKYVDTYQRLYPVMGAMMRLDYSSLTKENLDKLIDVLQSVIVDVKVKDKIIDGVSNEEITCLSEQAKSAFDELFSNSDLAFYGHSGNVDEIMKSGVFRCRYANLGSHFVSLSKNNKSLSKLNDWPHGGYKKIIILALNKYEYNPLYIARESKGSYDPDIYSIPIEYFAGYYDVEKQEFVANPKFKTTHEYNPNASIYQKELAYNGPITSSSDVDEFMKSLKTIESILIVSSENGLSINGLKEVKKQIIDLINKVYSLQETFTSNYLKDVFYKDLEIVNGSYDYEDVDEDFVYVDLDEDDNKSMGR